MVSGRITWSITTRREGFGLRISGNGDVLTDSYNFLDLSLLSSSLLSLSLLLLSSPFLLSSPLPLSTLIPSPSPPKIHNQNTHFSSCGSSEIIHPSHPDAESVVAHRLDRTVTIPLRTYNNKYSRPNLY